MNTFISKVINETRFEPIEAISLEHEIELTFAAESARHELEQNFDDITRTLDLTEALEGLAIVVSEINTPTPAQAALLQIAGDFATAGSGMDGSEITPSLEDVQENGTSIGGKVKAAVQTIIKAIKELLQRIGEVMHRYLQSIRAAIGGHSQRLQVIKERLAKSDYVLSGGQEFMMAMPVVGDKVLHSLPDVLKEAAHFNAAIDSFIHYANDFNISFASGLTDLYAKLSDGKLDVVEQFAHLEKFAASTSRVAGRMTLSMTAEPNIDYFDIKSYHSEDLLGGISIVQTTATMKTHSASISSASVRHAIEELMAHLKIKVVAENIGFTRMDVAVKPLTKAEMQQAMHICEGLIEHFTGKSQHASLCVAAARRLDLAGIAVKHIEQYLEKFHTDNIIAKEYADAALRVANAITYNATSPYATLTTAVNRCITLLLNAVLKSMNAHELHQRQEHLNIQHAKTLQQPV